MQYLQKLQGCADCFAGEVLIMNTCRVQQNHILGHSLLLMSHLCILKTLPYSSSYTISAEMADANVGEARTHDRTLAAGRAPPNASGRIADWPALFPLEAPAGRPDPFHAHIRSSDAQNADQLLPAGSLPWVVSPGSDGMPVLRSGVQQMHLESLRRASTSRGGQVGSLCIS